MVMVLLLCIPFLRLFFPELDSLFRYSDDGKHCNEIISSDFRNQLDNTNSSDCVLLSDCDKLDSTASSSNDVLRNNDASSSNTIRLPGNDDLLYALLLFDEQITWSDSENESLQGNTVDIEVISTNKDKSLQDILLDLNTKINHTEIFKFNISRGHLWEGAVRGRSSVKFR